MKRYTRMLGYCQEYESTKNELKKLGRSIERMMWKENITRCKSNEENAQVF